MTAHRWRSIAAAALLAAAAVPALLRSQPRTVTRSFKTWGQYLGGADSSQYSALDQINKRNVARLEVAWTYSTGDARSYRFNPIVVDGTMYVLARNNSIVALDPVTGREKWPHRNEGAVTDRGINYWESADGSDRRLLYLNAGTLTAIDARTGNIIASFGDNGRVDVRTGLHRDVSRIRPLQTNNPGRIYQNLMIVSLPAGGASYLASPGDTHAYDVRSGKLEWVFHTVPEKGEFGADTWPEAALETGSGVHNWAELTLDEARGIVYIPTGTARYDFYGGNRAGANLFANSIVALDAKTGKRMWHFQAVHHDLWDYDLATSPKLLTVKHDGRDVDVVAQASKHGFVFVFDRVTGQPLWPIEERPVPQSDVPGEQTSPTQPFPTLPPPFARQSFTERDVNPYLPPEVQTKVRDSLRASVNKGLFTPPSLQGSVQIPGNSGGANWGLSAVDPTKGTMYVVSKEQPALLTRAATRRGESRARRRGTGGTRLRSARPDAEPDAPTFESAGGVRAVHGGRSLRILPGSHDGRAATRSPVVADHRLRFEQGHHPLAGAEWRRAGSRRPRCDGHRQPGSPGRHGRHCRRSDLHRNARPQAARLRSGFRQDCLGERGQRSDQRGSCRLRDQRTPVHRRLCEPACCGPRRDGQSAVSR